MKCLQCGEEFTPRTVIQKYCSTRCARKYQRLHNVNENYPQITFTCPTCGKTVTTEGGARDKRTRFCCHSCEKKWWKHPPGENKSSLTSMHSLEEYASWERRTNE